MRATAPNGGSRPGVTDGTTTIDAPALIEILGATLSGDATEAVFTLPIQTGTGAPTDVVTPIQPGAIYADSGGGLWQAFGATSADWAPIMNTGSKLAIGVVMGSTSAQLWSVSGNSNGLRVLREDVGPTTHPIVQTASNVLDDGEAGTITANGGVIFPTADPHVAGAWWDNAGTLTKSAG